MKTSTIVWVIVIILIVIGGWYWLAMSGNSAATSPTGQTGLNDSLGQTNTGQIAVAPLLTIATSTTLGPMLVATNGMTLYYYSQDKANISNCTGTCATTWPPYTVSTSEPLVAGDGVTGQLSTITRADGSVQLTYKSVPLYFFANDINPGDTKGQNVGKFFVEKP